MIEKTKKVYYSEICGRHYFSKRWCARKESQKMIEKKYPSEHCDSDEFEFNASSGWNWRDDEKLVMLQKRLEKIILSQFKKNKASSVSTTGAIEVKK